MAGPWIKRTKRLPILNAGSGKAKTRGPWPNRGPFPKQSEKPKKKKRQKLKRTKPHLKTFGRNTWTLAKATKKPHTIYQEESAIKKWVFPVIARNRLRYLRAGPGTDQEEPPGRRTRTTHRSIYPGNGKTGLNFAIENGLLKGENPAKKSQKAEIDNKRLRFLSVTEAETLLAALKKKSNELHDQALMSLHTGARAGEVFRLELSDLDFETDQITLRIPKTLKPELFI